MSSYQEEYRKGMEEGLAMNPIAKIVNWNIERNMHLAPVDDCTVVYCKLEELCEYLGLNKCFTDDKQFKKFVNKYKGYLIEEALAMGATATVEEKVDALNDDSVFNAGFILRHGYEPTNTLNETVREIDSRTGDFDAETGKWQKFKTPEAMSLWVKADYSSCVLQGF